jgi:hypothetical protein
MVPLHGADGEEAVSVPKSSGSTTFFTIPGQKPKAEPINELRRADPLGPAPGGPPPGYVPAGAVPPTPIVPVAQLGISGPVAHSPYPPPAASLPPDTSQDASRARSYRVFAVVGALMLMVTTTMVVTVLLLVFGFTVLNTQGGSSGSTDVAMAPITPTPRGAGGADTGKRPDVIPPPIKPTPKPNPGGNGPKPGPRPAPTPAPAATGSVKLTLGAGAPPFTSVEISCSSASFRQRGEFSGGAAVVANVPAGDCYANFKGGPTATRVKVNPGDSLTCTFDGGTSNCR